MRGVAATGRPLAFDEEILMKPTLSDIARQTGLSVATVSRALHRSDSPNVSAATRRRVSEVARGLGYRPNLAGRVLATGRSHTVSYWTFDAFAPYYAMVASHITREASRRGYMIITNSTFDPAHALEPELHPLQASTALHSGFDGVIACDVAYPGNAFAAELRSLKTPFVGIGLNYPEAGDYVGLDLYAGATEAVRHLLDGGCRRIAMMCQHQRNGGSDPRARAYSDVLKEAGLEPEWILVEYHSRQHGCEAAAEYTAKKSSALPEAIFCLNDEIAVGCYRGLCDVGVRVPDDIRLIGCDGTEEAAYQACPITSIAPPVAEMCRLAWNALETRIADPTGPLQQIILQPTLVVRESSQ